MRQINGIAINEKTVWGDEMKNVINKKDIFQKKNSSRREVFISFMTLLKKLTSTYFQDQT